MPKGKEPQPPSTCPIKDICRQMMTSRRTGRLETGFVRNVSDAARNPNTAPQMLHCVGTNQTQIEPDELCQIDPFATRHLDKDLRYQIAVAQEPISDINL